MKIQDIILREIFDSRGEPTVEVCLRKADGQEFCSQVPSGKSRGKNEVAVLLYPEAKAVLEKSVKPALIDKDFTTLSELDNFLIALDGTKRKEKIGGNVALGISVAFARALAFEKNKPPWALLNEEFFGAKIFAGTPLIFSNLINGGAHAQNSLDFQEFLVVARSTYPISQTVQKLIELYKRLGEHLEKEKGIKNIPLGDEGGYSLDFANNFEPLQILEKLIFEFGLAKEFSLGIDAAASSMYKDGKYQFEGKAISTSGLVDVYRGYFVESKLLWSLEDPFAEEDFEGFRRFKKEFTKALVVGDDLTVTNPALIKKFSQDNLISGVIIKPNQIGTVSETCQAIRAARKHGLKFIISHRSGETEDPFIIELAKASGADGVKIGAPIRERIFKFDELIEVFET